MVVYEISIDPETLERLGIEIAFAFGESENLIDGRDEYLAALVRIEKSLQMICSAILDLEVAISDPTSNKS